MVVAIIESKHRQILYIKTAFERIMIFVDERFIVSLIDIDNKHPVSTSYGVSVF